MPTKKPRVQSILEPETYKELKQICEIENRSESQMIKIIIQEYVRKYNNKPVDELNKKQSELRKLIDMKSISE